MQDSKKPLKASDLTTKFQDSKSVNNEHLSESRTNVNLFVGNHFSKKTKQGLSRVMEKQADSDTKIRVTKNHTNTICKHIINSILGLAPSGAINPKNPSEMQDQKSAELHSSVWEDFSQRNKFKDHVRKWAHDYVVIGEVWVNLFWDENKGRFLGMQPQTNEMGEVTGEVALHEGDVCMERVWSWDVRMDTGAKAHEEAEWIGYEKMVSQDRILKSFGDTEEIRRACKNDMDETYSIFDTQKADYKNEKGRVLLRQMYFRPCYEYPKGHFVFFTKEMILAEGELPVDHLGNVFYPMKHVGLDEIPTSPRSASIIRIIRPDQMEVNRCASNIAQVQQTMGMDKMIVPVGGEVSADTTKAGIRIIKVPGGKAAADYIQGRSGEQFLNTMNSSISEMYRKTGVPEAYEAKTQDTDIMASLYKDERQSLQFSMYADKFGDFIRDIMMDVLRLKKAYMRDDAFVAAVGKSERINIAEFRAADDLGFSIKIEPSTGNLQSRYGKSLALTNIMQYMGTDLDNNTKGMLFKQLPFLNGEEIFSEYTLQYDTARNVMLSLDRGEMPDIVTSGDPDYFFKQLEMRKYKADFKFLPFQVQNNYLAQIEQYKAIYQQQLQEVQRAKDGFIPADGPTVPVEGMYEVVQGSNGQAKQQRVQIPQTALKWLIEQLQAQKMSFGQIESMPLGQQANIAGSFNTQQGTEMPEGPVNGSY
jgi:hypothetical protein